MGPSFIAVVTVTFLIQLSTPEPMIDLTMNPYEDRVVTETLWFKLSGGKWSEVSKIIKRREAKNEIVAQPQWGGARGNTRTCFYTEVTAGPNCKIDRLNVGLKCGGSCQTCRIAKLDLGLDWAPEEPESVLPPVPPIHPQTQCTTCAYFKWLSMSCSSPRSATYSNLASPMPQPPETNTQDTLMYPPETPAWPLHQLPTHPPTLPPLLPSVGSTFEAIPTSQTQRRTSCAYGAGKNTKKHPKNSGTVKIRHYKAPLVLANQSKLQRPPVSNNSTISPVLTSHIETPSADEAARPTDPGYYKNRGKVPLLYRNVHCKQGTRIIPTVCCTDDHSTELYDVVSTPRWIACEVPNCQQTCGLVEKIPAYSGVKINDDFSLARLSKRTIHPEIWASDRKREKERVKVVTFSPKSREEDDSLKKADCVVKFLDLCKNLLQLSENTAVIEQDVNFKNEENELFNDWKYPRIFTPSSPQLLPQLLSGPYHDPLRGSCQHPWKIQKHPITRKHVVQPSRSGGDSSSKSVRECTTCSCRTAKFPIRGLATVFKPKSTDASCIHPAPTKLIPFKIELNTSTSASSVITIKETPCQSRRTENHTTKTPHTTPEIILTCTTNTVTTAKRMEPSLESLSQDQWKALRDFVDLKIITTPETDSELISTPSPLERIFATIKLGRSSSTNEPPQQIITAHKSESYPSSTLNPLERIFATMETEQSTSTNELPQQIITAQKSESNLSSIQNPTRSTLTTVKTEQSNLVVAASQPSQQITITHETESNLSSVQNPLDRIYATKKAEHSSSTNRPLHQITTTHETETNPSSVQNPLDRIYATKKAEHSSSTNRPLHQVTTTHETETNPSSVQNPLERIFATMKSEQQPLTNRPSQQIQATIKIDLTSGTTLSPLKQIVASIKTESSTYIKPVEQIFSTIETEPLSSETRSPLEQILASEDAEQKVDEYGEEVDEIKTTTHIPSTTVNISSLLGLPEIKWYLQGAMNQTEEAYIKYKSALWDAQTDILHKTRNSAMSASLEMSLFRHQMYQTLQPLAHAKIDNFIVQRAVKLMTMPGISVLSEVKINEFEQVLFAMQTIHRSAWVPQYHAPRKKATVSKVISNVMATSDVPDEMSYYWVEWRKATGRRVKTLFEQYVDLMNQTALLHGFLDAGEMWTRRYEAEDFMQILASHYEDIRPVYQQLHAYVRRSLHHRYGEVAGVNVSGPIPAHLTGDVWGEDWGPLYRILAPYPQRPDPLKRATQQHKLTVEDITVHAENMFHSLGFPKLPPSFWMKSIFHSEQGSKDCHSSAWDMGTRNDFRVRLCEKDPETDFAVVHNLVTRVQYFAAYKDLPFAFREPANPAFAEAMGEALVLSAITRKHLTSLGLLESEPMRTHSARHKAQEQEEINFLMKQALTRLAPMPYSYIVDLWRIRVFQGDISAENYNSQWWKLRRQYQGVVPPIPRTEEDFDLGCNFRLVSNKPYINRFVSKVLEFQLQEGLCKLAGHRGPLHTCDISSSSKAGTTLRKAMAAGSSVHWRTILKEISKQRKLSTQPLLRYFQPLFDWLKAKNSAEKNPLGWN